MLSSSSLFSPNNKYCNQYIWHVDANYFYNKENLSDEEKVIDLAHRLHSFLKKTPPPTYLLTTEEEIVAKCSLDPERNWAILAKCFTLKKLIESKCPFIAITPDIIYQHIKNEDNENVDQLLINGITKELVKCVNDYRITIKNEPIDIFLIAESEIDNLKKVDKREELKHLEWKQEREAEEARMRSATCCRIL